MSKERYPLLRGKAVDGGAYSSPQGGIPPKSPVPERTPKLHANDLLRQLEAIEHRARRRSPDARDERASREIVAVFPEPHAQLDVSGLASKSDDVRLVGTDPGTGVVLLDAADAQLGYLRRKLQEYADDNKVRRRESGGKEVIKRAHEDVITPVRTVELARLETLAGDWLRAYDGDRSRARWFEIGCRGGRRRLAAESQTSRHQIRHQIARLGISKLTDTLHEFSAAERLYFFIRLSVDQMVRLVEAVDCILEIELVPPELRTWLFIEEQPLHDARQFRLSPPHQQAPSVVVLDSGISTAHPLLQDAILSASSVIPGISSAEDACGLGGHGTKVASVSLYDDLGSAIEAGQASAGHWIQSVRLLEEPGKGTASDEYWYRWPEMTEKAIERAEEEDPEPNRPRAFVMAVTWRASAPDGPTLWSEAVDELAYNDGRGRLLCVSAGDVPPAQYSTLVKDYPSGQLTAKLDDPAQAANILTVGAYTRKASLPPEPRTYDGARVVAPEGGISPFTTTGRTDRSWPIKPDVVFEGGNLVVAEGDFFDDQVPTLGTLATRRWGADGRPCGLISMTSEAVAHAGRMAASIWREDGKLWPQTVRGLIVHSASWTYTLRRQFEGKADRFAACGYGVPDLDFATACLKDRATIIVEDEMTSAVRVEVPREKPPKRKGTKATKTEEQRKLMLFRLPLPNELAQQTHAQAEMRITLSYFPEPNRFRRTLTHGLDLKWDMQGPQETVPQFLDRINEQARPAFEGKKKRPRQWSTNGFDWEIGPQLRNRGTVQSDRWRGPASMLAGDKLLAVLPVLGWWEHRRDELRFERMRFSLIVTVIAPDIHNFIRSRLTISVPQTVIV